MPRQSLFDPIGAVENSIPTFKCAEICGHFSLPCVSSFNSLANARNEASSLELKMQIEEVLTRQHGPLISTADLARLLGRTEQGLRFTVRGDSELARKLREARVQIGRRVHYRTAQVAALLEQGARS